MTDLKYHRPLLKGRWIVLGNDTDGIYIIHKRHVGKIAQVDANNLPKEVLTLVELLIRDANHLSDAYDQLSSGSSVDSDHPGGSGPADIWDGDSEG